MIPSQFSIPDMDMNNRVVSIGDQNDKNESKKAGESSTLNARSHTFDYKGGKLRLIDTPGIGDTGGREQDKKNFQNTLSLLAIKDPWICGEVN